MILLRVSGMGFISPVTAVGDGSHDCDVGKNVRRMTRGCRYDHKSMNDGPEGGREGGEERGGAVVNGWW